ncbi:MAG: FkbM family methyltransferase [Rhodobacteraceae bacterium HLUCCA08]|nr:MAG: FkbM family methyltransferase [Rhodobacteraceae bacterium HLUCCA08]
MASADKRIQFLIDLLAPERALQIADIGARITRSVPPYQALLTAGIAHLHGFEPEPEAYAELKAAADATMSIYPHAVGKPGPATFYAHHIGALSSVFRFCAPAARFLGKGFWVKRPITEIEMTLRALDDIEGLPGLDVLKMDVQGAELDVLRGGRRTLADTVMIVPEVRFYRMYEDEPMWADVDTELRARGFVLHKFLHLKSVVLPSGQKSGFHKRKGSQLLDGDAVYIRNVEDPQALSIHQLKALVLAAETVAGSPDLVAYCLEALRARDAVPGNAVRRYVKFLPPEMLAAPDPGPSRGEIRETI